MSSSMSTYLPTYLPTYLSNPQSCYPSNLSSYTIHLLITLSISSYLSTSLFHFTHNLAAHLFTCRSKCIEGGAAPAAPPLRRPQPAADRSKQTNEGGQQRGREGAREERRGGIERREVWRERREGTSRSWEKKMLEGHYKVLVEGSSENDVYSL